MDNNQLLSMPPAMDVNDYVASKSGTAKRSPVKMLNPFRKKAPDVFSKSISDITTRIIAEPIKKDGIRTLLNGKAFDPSIFADAKGLLPIVVWRAEECANYCFNEGSSRSAMKIGEGAVYEGDASALTGVCVSFEKIPAISSAYLLFVSEGAHSIREYIVERASASITKEVDVADFLTGFRERIDLAIAAYQAAGSAVAEESDRHDGENTPKRPTSGKIIF